MFDLIELLGSLAGAADIASSGCWRTLVEKWNNLPCKEQPAITVPSTQTVPVIPKELPAMKTAEPVVPADYETPTTK